MNRFSQFKISVLLIATILGPSIILAVAAVNSDESRRDLEREWESSRSQREFDKFSLAIGEKIGAMERSVIQGLAGCSDPTKVVEATRSILLRWPFSEAAVLGDGEGSLSFLALRRSAGSSAGSERGPPVPGHDTVRTTTVELSHAPDWLESAIKEMVRIVARPRPLLGSVSWLGGPWPGEQCAFFLPGKLSHHATRVVFRLDRERARQSFLEESAAEYKGSGLSVGIVPRLPADSRSQMDLGEELPAPFRGRYPARLNEPAPPEKIFSRSIIIGSTVCLVLVGVLLTLGTVVRGMRLAQLQSDFVSTVSHELRTPLTSISMFVEMLLMGRYDDENERTEYLNIVQRETERLKRLIERVLNFSKLEKGTKRFDFRLEDIGQVVLNTVTIFREQHRGSRYELDLTILQNLSPVLIDRDSIGEVLLNLLSNALKYSREPKKIRVKIRERRRQILVEVEDNGIGVRRRDRQRIFRKFYRADNSLSREVEGTGIGLAISWTIARAHRGDLSVSHARSGTGSRFTLSLPKAPTAARGREKATPLKGQ